MVGADVRGRRRPTDRRRHRRRSAAPRPALELRDPARSPARAHRAQAPGRLALGPRPRGPARRRRRADPRSRSAAPRNPQPPHQGRRNGSDRDHREGATEPRGRRRPPAHLADMLARHNDVEFDRGGMHFKVRVPDEVDFKLEIEIETTSAKSRSNSMVSDLDAPTRMNAERAQLLAERLHAGQRDRDGTQLIDHVRRVAAAVPRRRRAVAWLHEALEHTSISEQALLAEGLSHDELRAIRLLTRVFDPPSDAIYLAHRRADRASTRPGCRHRQNRQARRPRRPGVASVDPARRVVAAVRARAPDPGWRPAARQSAPFVARRRRSPDARGANDRSRT